MPKELMLACKVPLSLRQSALEQLGRPKGEKWFFLEVFCGCAALSLAVTDKLKGMSGKIVGPAVGQKQFPGDGLWRLCLDLREECAKTFLWQLILESQPWWIHIASECTLFTPMGRLTAWRHPRDWEQMLSEAKGMFNFAMHCLLHQSCQKKLGSWEQPPRCVNWKFQRVKYLLENGFHQVTFPSCSYGMKDLDTQRPIQKMQGFLSNANLEQMRRRCVCPGPRKKRHGRLEGAFRGPHEWAGTRKTAWSGRYPDELCQKMAEIIVRSGQ